jgi:cytochrome c
MKKLFQFLLFPALAVILFSCANKRSGKPRVLIFSKTTGFRHSSIPNGKAAIQKLGEQNGFDVDTTENADLINEDSLKKYSAVIFLHTTGDLLNNVQEADFERYIQAGGGYVGIHAAADAEYDWGWYGRLVGGYFLSHPKIQEAKFIVNDQTHISTKHLPKEWKRTDELYNYKKLNKDVHVLITIDEKSYEGGKNGDNHPMAWYHDYDGGRAFYTEMGHTEESWTEDNYLKHVLGGIKYAIGDNKELEYSKAKTQRTPDEDRFSKVVLTQATLFEPTEMTILPNLDVLIAQRRGELMMYKQKDSSVKQVGSLNVYWKTDTPDVNAEEGFLGLQADPDFEKNHYIFIYYSPKDTSVNRLSRFKFENDSLDMKSEKIVLQLYSQRQICCHTGGSIAFGPDHVLFLSTGDNSTPFDEPNQRYVNHGFAPFDDRPGHEQYDARRSAGNSNDLRGKILRIKMKDDGTYDIPDGNLFAKGEKGTRPEIYVMGNRNPYRISVDKKNSFLYWGEVGPDADSDSLDTRGPRGYDELNQARKAGYFGWPLFVGNNYPYHAYDYTTGVSGPPFDPAKPVNNSRNNTGIQNLPPVSPAFIWYPYAASPDFPQVGTGGRNAMAGPVYYTDMFPKETRLPDYYNNKLFIYEWMRGWIKAVTMLPNGDFDKMEPFMDHTKLANAIDLEVGRDGKLYILEYGTGWFTKNPDAGLSRIDFNAGNRAPKVLAFNVDKTSGDLPFTITATVEAKDPERDKLTYIWNLGPGIRKETTEPRLVYTFNTAGDYSISAEVKDDKNESVKTESVDVYAGNEAPSVNITVNGNQSFYFPGKQVQYAVSIEDKDDTSKAKDLTNLLVSANYAEGSKEAVQGHQVLTAAMIGRNMTQSLDCKTCHKPDEKSIGPSFKDVSERYKKDPNMVPYLVNKIIKGGGGVWGATAMSAHPSLKEEDARQIVSWIQTLSADSKPEKSLPPSGTLNATLNKPPKDNGLLYISATYTDKGGPNIKPLTGTYTRILRNSKLSFNGVSKTKGFAAYTFNGMALMIVPKGSGWFSIDSIDLAMINGVSLMAAWQSPPATDYIFELHLDSPDGKKIGEFILPGVHKPQVTKDKNPKMGGLMMTSKLEPVTDGKLHNIYVVSKAKDPNDASQFALQWIQFLSK